MASSRYQPVSKPRPIMGALDLAAPKPSTSENLNRHSAGTRGFARSEPSCLRRQRTQRMTTLPTATETMSITANDLAPIIASPKVKLRRRRIAIDHPDPRTGEKLLAEAIGAVDRDALHGLLSQLVKASAVARRPDQGNLSFMVSMLKSIAPKDSLEAMLAAQMVSIHVASMRCACRLALTDDVPQQESLSRALTRLARTYTAQMEALSRHRSNGTCAITVQNLSVQDGGKAVVGHFTQHANLIAAQPGLVEAVPA